MSSARSIVLIAAIVAIAATVTTAFAPTDRPRTSYVPMKRVGYASTPPSNHNNRHRCTSGICRRMATESETEAAKLKEQAAKLREEAAAAAGVSVDELMSKSVDGTIYDDETDVAQKPRDNLSNSMKERLKREASTGLDSEKSQPNVILYISIGVAILVALGGQGILY